MRRKEYVDGQKHCSRCDQWKAPSEYHVSAHTWDRRNAHCRECVRAQNRRRYERHGARLLQQAKEWRIANPDKRKDMALRRKFGITLEAYRKLEADQGGSCAVCRRSAELHVDHCHATGAVRGLLCMPCNTAIGQLGDDPERIRAAASYVEAWR